jgi:hypothetical protein
MSDLSKEPNAPRAPSERSLALLFIYRDWQYHQRAPVPTEWAGKYVGEIDLVTLDYFTSGCVSAYLKKIELDGSERAILERCKEDLDVVCEALDGYADGYSVSYYKRLRKLATAVLDHIERF